MKKYPIGSPPETAGLYILTNRKTGQIYIGRSINLRRRYAEWKGALVQRIGVKNKKFFEAIDGSTEDDWEFGILASMPGATDEELAAAEERAILHVTNKRPTAILNGLIPTTKPIGPSEASAPKSSIIDDNGNEMSYADVAAALGVTIEAVRKRLKKYRSRGVYKIAFSVLKAKSDQYWVKKGSEKSLDQNPL
jgi:hypothetical protein